MLYQLTSSGFRCFCPFIAAAVSSHRRKGPVFSPHLGRTRGVRPPFCGCPQAIGFAQQNRRTLLQKKRRPRASLFLEQGTAVLLCKTDRLRAPAKRRADAARPPQVRRKNRTLAAVTAYSRRDERAETAETAGSKLIQHPQATGPQAVTAAQPAATPGRRHTRPIPPTAMQADATGGERRSVPGRSCGRSAPPRPPAGGS